MYISYCRLLEVAGHLDAIAEQMKLDSQIPIKVVLNNFHAEEINELAAEIKSLLDKHYEKSE